VERHYTLPSKKILIKINIYFKLNSFSYILQALMKQNTIFVEADIFILFAIFIEELVIIPSVSKRLVSHC
jgi:hypothetical protein